MVLRDVLPSQGDEVAGVRIEDEVAAAMSESIHRATSLADPTRRLLVTACPPERPLLADRAMLSYPIRGVARLEAITDVSGSFGMVRLLIEREPAGVPIASLAPMPVGEAARLLVQLLAIVEEARDTGYVLRGIHPLLCYVDRGSLSQIAPRALPFVSSARPKRGGCCLADAYAAPEEWRRQPVSTAADVFSTCALGWHLVAGAPPFPAEPTYMDGVRAVLSGAPPVGDAGALAPILLRGLATDPRGRPSPEDLRGELERAAREHTR